MKSDSIWSWYEQVECCKKPGSLCVCVCALNVTVWMNLELNERNLLLYVPLGGCQIVQRALPYTHTHTHTQTQNLRERDSINSTTFIWVAQNQHTGVHPDSYTSKRYKIHCAIVCSWIVSFASAFAQFADS